MKNPTSILSSVFCLLSSVGCLTARYNAIEDDGILPPKVTHHSVYLGVMPDHEPIMAAAQAKAITATSYAAMYGYNGAGYDIRAPSERFPPVEASGVPETANETATPGFSAELEKLKQEVAEARKRADAAGKATHTLAEGLAAEK